MAATVNVEKVSRQVDSIIADIKKDFNYSSRMGITIPDTSGNSLKNLDMNIIRDALRPEKR